MKYQSITRQELTASTLRSKNLLAVDTGGKIALARQRAFIRWCLRLQTSLQKRFPEIRLVSALPNANHASARDLHGASFVHSFHLMQCDYRIDARITVYLWATDWAGVLVSKTDHDILKVSSEKSVVRAVNSIARKLQPSNPATP